MAMNVIHQHSFNSLMTSSKYVANQPSDPVRKLRSNG